MTRIIAGFAGSRELSVPKSGTRPTSDRVREAVFSALDAHDEVQDARALDLFAGSGALGLEALSRGASLVTLVEKNAAAAAIARRNAEMVCSMGDLPSSTVRVVVTTAEKYLSASADEFDLVFIDPPYDFGDDEVDAILAGLVRMLADDALVVVERSTRSRVPLAAPGLTLERSKSYGETTVHWFRRD